MNKKIKRLIEIFYYYKPYEPNCMKHFLETATIDERITFRRSYYIYSKLLLNDKGEIIYEQKKAL